MDADSPLLFQSTNGPESLSPEERRSDEKESPFPSVNAVAQEEAPPSHGTTQNVVGVSMVLRVPSNDYPFHREGENYAKGPKDERTMTGTSNDENIQEPEEETNIQGMMVTKEHNGENDREALEKQENQSEGKRCEANDVQAVSSPQSASQVKVRGEGKTSLCKNISKPI